MWLGDGPTQTPNLVMGETWTWLHRRALYPAALRFVAIVSQSPRVSIAVVDKRAWEWPATHDERSYSYVDATSFEIMRRERITDALAFDGDFSAVGIVEVRP